MSSLRVLGFIMTDSALNTLLYVHLYVRTLNTLLYVLFHDYRMMWAESSLPVGPNPRVNYI